MFRKDAMMAASSQKNNDLSLQSVTWTTTDYKARVDTSQISHINLMWTVQHGGGGLMNRACFAAAASWCRPVIGPTVSCSPCMLRLNLSWKNHVHLSHVYLHCILKTKCIMSKRAHMTCVHVRRHVWGVTRAHTCTFSKIEPEHMHTWQQTALTNHPLHESLTHAHAHRNMHKTSFREPTEPPIHSLCGGRLSCPRASVRSVLLSSNT